jgi:hypothetical protein
MKLAMMLVIVAFMTSSCATPSATRESVCLANMEQVLSAAWRCHDHGSTQFFGSRADGAEDPTTSEMLSHYLTNGVDALKCPSGGRYILAHKGLAPQCSIHGTLIDARLRVMCRAFASAPKTNRESIADQLGSALPKSPLIRAGMEDEYEEPTYDYTKPSYNLARKDVIPFLGESDKIRSHGASEELWYLTRNLVSDRGVWGIYFVVTADSNRVIHATTCVTQERRTETPIVVLDMDVVRRSVCVGVSMSGTNTAYSLNDRPVPPGEIEERLRAVSQTNAKQLVLVVSEQPDLFFDALRDTVSRLWRMKARNVHVLVEDGGSGRERRFREVRFKGMDPTEDASFNKMKIQ